MMQINEILIKPLQTEKSTNLSKDNCYVFEVHKKANKFQIKHAIETLFKVKVKNVKVNVRKGKKRKRGKRMIEKKLSDKKIAYVKLKSGKIDIYPQT